MDDDPGAERADLGPVEYLVIDFPGNRFNGDIAPALADFVERGIVRILDLVFVKKDADGSVTVLEYDEVDEGAAFADIDGDAGELLGDDDVLLLADDIPPDSSALFLLWEDLWARDLSRAVRSAGGEVTAGARIPHRVVQQVVGSLAAEGTPTNAMGAP